MEHTADGLLGRLLTAACGRDRLPQLLRLIFRRHELEKFNNRVAILQGLTTGKTYEKIRGELGVGVDTIARMSLILEPNQEVVEELLAEVREIGGDKGNGGEKGGKELPALTHVRRGRPALPREEEVILLPAVEGEDQSQPLPAREAEQGLSSKKDPELSPSRLDRGGESSRGGRKDRKRSIYKFG